VSGVVVDRPRVRALARAILRFGLKPVFAPQVPLAFQRRYVEAAASGNLPPRGTRASEETLGGVPGERVQPPAGPGNATIVYLHGGGYVLGSARADRVLAAGLAQGAGASAFAPDYRLAPEYPFPAALDDAVAVYRALLERGADPNAIALAGDSAGGGLTLATALRLREEGLPLPAALVLISPWLDLTLSGASVSERADADPMLSVAGVASWAALYLDGRSADEPGASPLFADLTGLPPTLVQVGSDEILLSDSERFTERAGAAGVTVELEVYEGLWHDFQLHAGVLSSSGAALERAGAFIGRHLSR